MSRTTNRKKMKLYTYTTWEKWNFLDSDLRKVLF